MNATPRAARDLFLPHEAGFVRGTWFAPQSAGHRIAVLVVPGIGHEERRMNVGLVAAAEALAARGLAVLFIDLHGCALADGRLGDPDIDAEWRREIVVAHRHLRDAGFDEVIVIGIRLGATLAIDALQSERLAALVAWAPVVSGRRHIRELRVMQKTDPAGGAMKAIEIGGFAYPARLLETIATLDLAALRRLDARRLLVVDREETASAPWLERPAGAAPVDHVQAHDLDSWLFDVSDEAPSPMHDIQTITEWCVALAATLPNDAAAGIVGRDSVVWSHGGRAIRETFVELPPLGLSAVLCEPAEPAARGDSAVRLILSTVGPGRTFCDFARDDAARGQTSLRFDFAGLGSSARRDGAETVFYTDPVQDDIIAAVKWLRRKGHRHIHALGFCAGAWSMLQAGPLPGLDAVVGINVAFYRQPGPAMPVAPPPWRRWSRYTPRLLRAWFRALRRSLRKPPSAGEPMRWLARLCDARLSVMLPYADHDFGLELLRQHLARPPHDRLRPRLRIEIYPGLGHLMEGSAARERMFADIADHFAVLSGSRTSSDFGAPAGFVGTSPGSL